MSGECPDCGDHCYLEPNGDCKNRKQDPNIRIMKWINTEEHLPPDPKGPDKYKSYFVFTEDGGASICDYEGNGLWSGIDWFGSFRMKVRFWYQPPTQVSLHSDQHATERDRGDMYPCASESPYGSSLRSETIIACNPPYPYCTQIHPESDWGNPPPVSEN